MVKTKVVFVFLFLMITSDALAQSIKIECGSEDNGGFTNTVNANVGSAGGVNWTYGGIVGELTPGISVNLYTSMYKVNTRLFEHEHTAITFFKGDELIGSASMSLTLSQLGKPFHLGVAASHPEVDPEGLGCMITLLPRRTR